jgi:hypothetical protein
MKKYYDTELWLTVFEGEGDGGGDKGGSDDKGGGDKETLTKAEVQALLETERKKYQTSQQKALDELKALRTRVKLTDDERKDLDTRLEAMQNEYLTKEELRKREIDKQAKKHEEELNKLRKESEQWKGLYTETSIQTAIAGAAMQHKAYNPNQVLAILRPSTLLEEAVDGEGNPTGQLVPKVDFKDKDKDGKPITLKLSIDDAVKRMADMDDFANLFAGDGADGLGHRPVGKSGGRVSITTLANDAKKYREAKKKGLIDLS